MASSLNRGQIVQQALTLAGRSTELKQSANIWLNMFLKHVSMTYRFPELRKVGAATSLSIGSSTAPLPSDFGAGMAKSGMVFGSDNKPMDEKDFEDFVVNNGFPPTNNTGSGRPMIYIVDREAGVFRFNMSADTAYPFFPVYFRLPTIPDASTQHDTDSVWISDDIINVEGLKWFIYVFTEDEREMAQEARVDKMLMKWERQVTQTGGVSRIMPSPARFKQTRFRGLLGP